MSAQYLPQLSQMSSRNIHSQSDTLADVSAQYLPWQSQMLCRNIHALSDTLAGVSAHTTKFSALYSSAQYLPRPSQMSCFIFKHSALNGRRPQISPLYRRTDTVRTERIRWASTTLTCQRRRELARVCPILPSSVWSPVSE